jgi:hypothetical protein
MKKMMNSATGRWGRAPHTLPGYGRVPWVLGIWKRGCPTTHRRLIDELS